MLFLYLLTLLTKYFDMYIFIYLLSYYYSEPFIIKVIFNDYS